jgi:hypothetical protein
MRLFKHALNALIKLALRTQAKYQCTKLDHNINVTTEEFEYAHRLAQHLGTTKQVYAQGASNSGLTWKDPNDQPVYGTHCKHNLFDPTYEFINQMRLFSSHFTGYDLRNLLERPARPSWTDIFAYDDWNGADANEPDWSIRAFGEIARLAPDAIANEPPPKLGEIGFMVDRHLVNRDIVAYQERLAILMNSGVIEALRGRSQLGILEIGAGFGGLAYRLKRLLPGAIYYICDLPESLVFSSVYLSLMTNDRTCIVYDGTDRRLLHPTRPAFVFVPAHLFSHLKEMRIDLAINTLSFAEMAAETVDQYAKGITVLVGTRGALFEQNFDNSHYHLPTHCNPEIILKKHFAFYKDLTEHNRWGKANLWYNGRDNWHAVRKAQISTCTTFPKIIDQNYQGFMIVLYRYQFYAFRASMGWVDVTKMSKRKLRDMAAAEECVVGETVGAVKAGIEKVSGRRQSLKMVG